MIIVTAISQIGDKYEVGIPVPNLGPANTNVDGHTWLSYLDKGVHVSKRVDHTLQELQDKILTNERAKRLPIA